MFYSVGGDARKAARARARRHADEAEREARATARAHSARGYGGAVPLRSSTTFLKCKGESDYLCRYTQRQVQT